MSNSDITREVAQSVLGPRASIHFLRPFQHVVKKGSNITKTLALTDYRLHVLSMKSSSKAPQVEVSCNFLDINSINSIHLPSSSGKLLISLKSNQIESKSIEICFNSSESDDQVIFKIVEILTNTFPDSQIENLIGKIEIMPESRWSEIQQRLECVKRPVGICGNFSLAYACVCDQMRLTYLDDVAWDVDTIYHAHSTSELTLTDFDYLEPRLYATIISAVQHNRYFTGLNLSNVKLGPDCLQEVLEVMKTNSSIKELSLASTGIKQDFIQKLISSFSLNKLLSLISLDLSGNAVEEKGVQHLISAVNVTSKITHLNLSSCGLNSKTVGRLFETAFANSRLLTSLDLSDNNLKDEMMSLQNFLRQSNSMTVLKLSGTECHLEQILTSISQGCCHKLVHLDLSRNTFKKFGKDTNMLTALNYFFSNTASLRIINLSATKMPVEVAKQVLLGIGSNVNAVQVELNLSCNAFGSGSVLMFESLLPEIHGISSLDLSENGFDQSLSNIAFALTRSSGYEKILLGRNFSNANKLKNLTKILDQIAQLLQVEISTIRSLSLDDLKMKSDVTVIFNALGTNAFLVELDISGNQMGDVGVHLLAKALQVNNKLETIFWDNNGTTANGFNYMATALSKNYTLKKMPVPIQDVTAVLRNSQDKDKVLQALKKIDSVLTRNQDPQKFTTEQSYRLQQSFLTGTTQQILDRMVLNVEDLVVRLRKFDLTKEEQKEVEGANALIKEEHSVGQIFTRLRKLSDCIDSENGSIYAKFSSFITEMKTVIGKQIQATMNDGIKALETIFPVTLGNQPIPGDLKSSCLEHCSISDAVLKESVMDSLGIEIMNKTHELQLIVFTHLVTFTVEGLLSSLHGKTISLSQICSKYQQMAEGEYAGANRSGSFSKDARAQNKAGTIRKSIQQCMVRPLSVVFGAETVDLPDDGDVFVADAGKSQQIPKDSKSGVGQSKNAVSASSKSIEKKSKMAASSSSSTNDVIDCLKEETDGQKLIHPCKSRPKRTKTQLILSPNGIYPKSFMNFEFGEMNSAVKEVEEDDEEEEDEEELDDHAGVNGGSKFNHISRNGQDTAPGLIMGHSKSILPPRPAGGSRKPQIPGFDLKGGANQAERKTICPPSTPPTQQSPVSDNYLLKPSAFRTKSEEKTASNVKEDEPASRTSRSSDTLSDVDGDEMKNE